MKTTNTLPGVLTLILVLAVQARAQSFLTNGLVAYYPFSGNANDASGNGNDGTISGVQLVTNRLGTVGSSYQFGGSNSVITVDSLSSVNLSELTLSVWVNPFAVPGADGQVIIHKWKGYTYSLEDYGLGLTSDLNIQFWNGRHGTPYGIITTNQLSLARWYHLVVTLDSAGTGKLWVNGSLRVQGNILPLLPPATEPVRFGQAPPTLNGAAGQTFNGQLDDIRIYNRALSDSEVKQLYVYESGPRVDLIKAVKPSFSGLSIGTNYLLQLSGDLNTWTNHGSAFAATNANMFYPEYFDVENWGNLFFRLQVSP